jgi:MoxR-like ATPase
VNEVSTWRIYIGTGKPGKVTLPDPPPWRRFDGKVVRERTISNDSAPEGAAFQATMPMIEAVNAALYLRRPLLLTGRPGSGKSSLIQSVASELKLGRVLQWHVTSGSTLKDALYRYDAIGRLQEHQLTRKAPAISTYMRLGPLGTALLPTDRPRALLIDEIDKSDVDLPGDLLHVFERGEFEIPELTRLPQTIVHIREEGGSDRFPIKHGVVRCRQFPFVVLTSNGERDFPAPFLRRCIRLRMPEPTPTLLDRIITAHLGEDVATKCRQMIRDFAQEDQQGRAQATDQLMNALFIVTRELAPESEEREHVVQLLLKELTTDPA